MREKHGTIIDFDTDSVLAEALTKTLPAVKPHATNQLDHEEVEYIPREYDSLGEAKISLVGELWGGRIFRIRTFVIPHRGEKHLMLATECARVLGYRDSYLLFNKNQSLLKIIATQQDKEDLIQQGILPYSYRSRQIPLVSAKSIFRQFGARVIEGGRRVRDDYWEAKAVKSGYTEEDMPGHGQSRSAKTMGVAGQAEHSAQRSSSLETSTPRQYGNSGHKNRVDPINLGRVDALGPPSLDNPMVILLSIYSIEQISPPSVPFAMRFGHSR